MEVSPGCISSSSRSEAWPAQRKALFHDPPKQLCEYDTEAQANLPVLREGGLELREVLAGVDSSDSGICSRWTGSAPRLLLPPRLARGNSDPDSAHARSS